MARDPKILGGELESFIVEKLGKLHLPERRTGGIDDSDEQLLDSGAKEQMDQYYSFWRLKNWPYELTLIGVRYVSAPDCIGEEFWNRVSAGRNQWVRMARLYDEWPLSRRREVSIEDLKDDKWLGGIYLYYRRALDTPTPPGLKPGRIMQPKYWKGVLDGMRAEGRVMVSLVEAWRETIQMDELAGSGAGHPEAENDLLERARIDHPSKPVGQSALKNRPWEHDEVIKLRGLRKKGRSYREIGRSLGRTKFSVRYKCHALSLKKGA